MNRFGRALALTFVLVFLGTSNNTEASDGKRFFHKMIGKDLGIDTLIVTKNYIQPRILAELVQQKTSSTVVLILPTEEESSMYAIRKAKAGQDTVKFNKSKFKDFINILDPRSVIFIGNTDKDIPAEYVKQLSNDFAVVTVKHEDMTKVAKGLGGLMRIYQLEDTH